MLPRLSLVLTLLTPAPRAVAQLYSWHEDGEKRISVTPPAWYRAALERLELARLMDMEKRAREEAGLL